MRFSQWLKLREMAAGVVHYDDQWNDTALRSEKSKNKFLDVISRHPDFTFNFVFKEYQDLLNRGIDQMHDFSNHMAKRRNQVKTLRQQRYQASLPPQEPEDLSYEDDLDQAFENSCNSLHEVGYGTITSFNNFMRRSERGSGKSNLMAQINKMEHDIVNVLGVNTEGCITVAITASTAKRQGDLMPQTPWNRIHRACHGFIGGEYSAGRYVDLQNRNFDMIHDVVDQTQIFQDQNPADVFVFQSLENDIRPAELYREMLTEYIWHGGRMRVKNPYYETVLPKIYKVMHKALEAFVGKIIIEGPDFQ